MDHRHLWHTATIQGRHLYALKISDNVAVDEDEPAMLIVAAHHAREISTPIIALHAAERLASGYGTAPEITAAVDANEVDRTGMESRRR